jgi:FtsZ-interacting cell division protein YlmF
MSVQETTSTEQSGTTQVVETPKIETTTISFDRPAEVANAEAAKTEDQQVDAQAEEGQQTDRDDKGRFKGVQPRIDELTRARREAEREAAYWRGVAQQGQAQTSAPAAPIKPTPDKYNDYGEYVEALTDWKAEQAVAKRMEQDSSRKVVETRTQTFAERQVAAREVMPDYDAVVGASDTPISNHVGEAIMESDRGPELAYHFAKNPDVLMNLNGMSPTQAAREIGKLEATLPTVKPPVVPSKKLSTTPAPASTTVTQGRATQPALATASMDEYMAQRKSQGARWAR